MPAFTTRYPLSPISPLSQRSMMDKETSPQSSQRTLVVTPGYDVTIHVEEKQDEQGAKFQDDGASNEISHKKSEHVMQTAEKTPARDTKLRIPPSKTKKTKKLSTKPATKTNMSFSTIYASRSRVKKTTTASLPSPRPIYPTSTPTYGWTSRAQFQQATSTTAVVIGGQSLGRGAASTSLLCIVIALLIMGLVFAVKVYMIVVHRSTSFKDCTLWKVFKRRDSIVGGHEKKDANGHKHSGVDPIPVFCENTFGKRRYLQEKHKRN
jgi:hypothetical protein